MENIKVNTGVAPSFTYEEADAYYGDEITRRHNEAAKRTNKRESALKNLEKAHESNVERGHITQAVIVGLILSGLTKQKASYRSEYSYATVHRAMKDLDETSFRALYEQYRATIYRYMDESLFQTFIDCDCNYKAYIGKVGFQNTVEGIEENLKALNNGLSLFYKTLALIDEFDRNLVVSYQG
jgi:hypothetical protein